MKPKAQYYITIGIALLFIVSIILFNKEYIPKGILYNNNFDDGFAGFLNESCCNHSLKIVNNMAEVNSLCIDPLIANGMRSEIKLAPVPAFSERWYGFSIYFPQNWSNNYKGSNDWILLAQWHSVNNNYAGPPIALSSLMGGIIGLSVKNGVIETRYNITTINDVAGKRTDWVFHIKLNYSGGGLVETWLNGNKVVTHNGVVGYNENVGPYFKTGIYRGLQTQCPITLYIDNFKVGNESSNYNEVNPRN